MTLQELAKDHPDLIAQIEAGKHLPYSVVEVEHDPFGRGYKKWKEKIVDPFTGEVITSRVEESAYNKDDLLDTITRKRYSGDEDVLEKEETVKYEPGKKPVVTDVTNKKKK